MQPNKVMNIEKQRQLMAHMRPSLQLQKKQKEVGTGQVHSCPSEDTTGPGQLGCSPGALEAPRDKGSRRCGSTGHSQILSRSELKRDTHARCLLLQPPPRLLWGLYADTGGLGTR